MVWSEKDFTENDVRLTKATDKETTTKMMYGVPRHGMEREEPRSKNVARLPRATDEKTTTKVLVWDVLAWHSFCTDNVVRLTRVTGKETTTKYCMSWNCFAAKML